MLPYFRKLIYVAFFAAALISVVLIYIYYLAFGSMATTMTLVISFIGFFMLSEILMIQLMRILADKLADSMISLYNDQCDPYAFVKKAKPIAQKITAPYNETGSWFLSYYALALVDLGCVDDAAKVGCDMQQSICAAEQGSAKATMMVNIEPLVLRLFGPKDALEIVDEALNADGSSAGQWFRESGQFLTSERSFLLALENNDENQLLARYSQIRLHDGFPLRMRVLAANDEAVIHNNQGDTAAAEECYRFVCENGATLPCVSAAKEYLGSMS